jgi:preprotein translocase subunit SecY
MKRSAWRYLWSAHDIRRKLLITLLILALYRLASHVPVPGADKSVMTAILNAGGATGNLINILDLLSGGTVSRTDHPSAAHPHHPLLAKEDGR